MRWLLVAVVVVLVAVLAWLLGEDVEAPPADVRPDEAPEVAPPREASPPAPPPAESSSRGRREERAKRQAEQAAKPRPTFEPGRIDSDAVSRWDLTIRGVVVDLAGAPIRGATVRVLTSRVHPADRDFQVVRGDRQNESRSTDGLAASRAQETNAEGRFAIPLQSEGRLLIVVYAHGYRIARGALGWVNLSRSGIRFTLERAGGGRLRLVRGDEALRRVEVRLADMSSGDWQPRSPAIATDTDGRMPTEWLEQGHVYSLSVVRNLQWEKEAGRAKKHGVFGTYVLWSDQAQVDVSRRTANQVQEHWATNARRAEKYRLEHPSRAAPASPIDDR